ncbi:MAG TPA: hypothetical protein VEC17_01290 [Candidatus Binatia bacterium]|nr:hypothetical protein [Candidatus Binatia bacterium]
MDTKLQEIEKEIEKLYAEQQEKIEQENLRVVAMPFIEGAQKRIREDYSARIQTLERQRKFLIERVSIKNSPWYKDRTIVITLIVGIIGAIATLLEAVLN